MPSTERQGHGFAFERYIAERYGVKLSNIYTSQWDGELNGYPVSIKTEKLGSDIELADFRRNAENTESFYLIVGFWENQKDNIVKIETLFINGEEWHRLFPQHFIEDFSNMLASVTNDAADDTKWRALIAEQKRIWRAETKNYIRPRFKRDHRSQKRVQCAINNRDFYNYFVTKYHKEIEINGIGD